MPDLTRPDLTVGAVEATRPEVDGDRFELREAATTIGPFDARRFLAWLAQAPHQAPVAAWPVILLPDFVAGAGTMPADSVELYQRVEWAGTVPAGRLEARVSPRWARSRGERTEYGLRAEVTVGGRRAAASLIVCLTRARIEAFGHPQPLSPPEPGELNPVRQLSIGEEEVREYSEAVRSFYPVTSRPTAAREMGFRSALVPGPMLTALHLAVEPALPGRGTVEVWFRRPITAGSAVAMCSGPAGSGIRGLRSIGATEPATVSRLRPAPGQQAGSHPAEAQQ